MIRSAGSSSRTAAAADSNRAASITSAQATSSARSSARQPNRSRRVRAMNPVQLGAVGSQNFWPVASRSKACAVGRRGEGAGVVVEPPVKPGGEAEVDAGHRVGVEGVRREGVALLVLQRPVAHAVQPRASRSRRKRPKRAADAQPSKQFPW